MGRVGPIVDLSEEVASLRFGQSTFSMFRTAVKDKLSTGEGRGLVVQADAAGSLSQHQCGFHTVEAGAPKLPPDSLAARAQLVST